MTETQERFLRSVLTRVPLDSVVEMHLFPPIRRGTLETGVAVIATALPPAPLTVVDGDASEAVVIDETTVADIDDAHDAGAVVIEADADAVTDADSETDSSIEAVADDATDVLDETMPDPQDDESDVEAIVSESGDAEESIANADDAPAGDDDAAWGDEADVITVAAPVPSPRMRILTASYRHTIKGVERGKWTVDVQEEADAPLEAVELVLRGVRHRSTEPADPELVSHDALMALLTPAAVAPAA